MQGKYPTHIGNCGRIVFWDSYLDFSSLHFPLSLPTSQNSRRAPRVHCLREGIITWKQEKKDELVSNFYFYKSWRWEGWSTKYYGHKSIQGSPLDRNKKTRLRLGMKDGRSANKSMLLGKEGTWALLPEPRLGRCNPSEEAHGVWGDKGHRQLHSNSHTPVPHDTVGDFLCSRGVT